MQLTLVRNATLILEYAGQRLLIDPYFAPRHSLPSFTGKSKNPMVDLPYTIDEIIDGVEMVLVSHLHADHFDTVAQEKLTKTLPVFCQPGDIATIQEKGFNNVTAITDTVSWQGIKMTRIEGHHGSDIIEKLMGTASGFVFQADNEPTVYWAGDTILCDEVRAAIQDYQPDVIVTHSCGATWLDKKQDNKPVLIVMDAIQTIAVAELAPESTIIATHMDSLDHSTISRMTLRQVADDAGLSTGHLSIPDDGDALNF